jgi:hypothetical protein
MWQRYAWAANGAAANDIIRKRVTLTWVNREKAGDDRPRHEASRIRSEAGEKVDRVQGRKSWVSKGVPGSDRGWKNNSV